MDNQSRSRLVVALLLGFVAIAGLFFLRFVLLTKGDSQPQRKFRILSYSTFISAAGPGQQLIEDFKAKCDCEVDLVTAGDGGLLLERLRLSKADDPFDLVIGLDQLAVERARTMFKWKPIDLPALQFSEPAVRKVRSDFVPFDWSPMTFIYRKGEVEPPNSLDDLLNARFAHKIAIQDPQASTPGLQLLAWISLEKRDKTKEFLEKLQTSIQSIAPSWSFSYGLFKKGQASLVFSYITSLVYHWEVERDHRYQAAVFSGGHPYQVEYVGIPGLCRECNLARDFILSMLSVKGQLEIAKRNFMYPVIQNVEPGETFKQLPSITLVELPEQTNLEPWLQTFRK